MLCAHRLSRYNRRRVDSGSPQPELRRGTCGNDGLSRLCALPDRRASRPVPCPRGGWKDRALPLQGSARHGGDRGRHLRQLGSLPVRNGGNLARGLRTRGGPHAGHPLLRFLLRRRGPSGPAEPGQGDEFERPRGLRPCSEAPVLSARLPGTVQHRRRACGVPSPQAAALKSPRSSPLGPRSDKRLRATH